MAIIKCTFTTVSLFIVYLWIVDCSTKVKRASVAPIWPSKTISYDFYEDNFNEKQRQKLRNSLKLLEDSLIVNGEKCLQFKQRKKEEEYLLFKDSEAYNFCYVDEIGYMGNTSHAVNLDRSSCLQEKIIIHEVLHALGFAHEHNRFDRDEYVNISSHYLPHETMKVLSNNKSYSLDTPYDFTSLMVYPSYLPSGRLFQLSNNPSLLRGKLVKTNKKLSIIDIIQIQRLYNCTEAPIQHVDSIDSISLNDTHLLRDKLLKTIIEETNTSSDVVSMYVNRTLETCGISHYWPLDYPIVAKPHDLHRTVCLKKRKDHEFCKISIECESKCLKSILSSAYGICSNEKYFSFKHYFYFIQNLKKSDLAQIFEDQFY